MWLVKNFQFSILKKTARLFTPLTHTADEHILGIKKSLSVQVSKVLPLLYPDVRFKSVSVHKILLISMATGVLFRSWNWVFEGTFVQILL